VTNFNEEEIKMILHDKFNHKLTNTNESIPRYSIRKLTIGAASCLIGCFIFMQTSNTVQAAESDSAEVKTEQVDTSQQSVTSAKDQSSLSSQLETTAEIPDNSQQTADIQIRNENKEQASGQDDAQQIESETSSANQTAAAPLSQQKTLVVGDGEDNYESLHQAVEQAADGDTISIEKDIKEKQAITIDKDLTIVGNGSKVSFDDATLEGQTVLTIADGKTVNFSQDSSTGFGLKTNGHVDINGTLNINEGFEFSSTGSFQEHHEEGIYSNTNTHDATSTKGAIVAKQGSTLNISGGKFSPAFVWYQSGSTGAITGGEFTNNHEIGLYWAAFQNLEKNSCLVIDTNATLTEISNADFKQTITGDVSSMYYSSTFPGAVQVSRGGRIDKISNSRFESSPEFLSSSGLSNYGTIGAIDSSYFKGGHGFYNDSRKANGFGNDEDGVTSIELITNSTFEAGQNITFKPGNLNKNNWPEHAGEGFYNCNSIIGTIANSYFIGGQSGLLNGSKGGGKYTKIKKIENSTFEADEINCRYNITYATGLRNSIDCTIDEISDCRFTGRLSGIDNLGNISNLFKSTLAVNDKTKFKLDAGLYNESEGTIGEIKNSTITGDAYGILNTGKIATLTDVTAHSIGRLINGERQSGYGLSNNIPKHGAASGSIDMINGGEFIGVTAGVENKGTIAEIKDGKFIGGESWVVNTGKLSQIDGGVYWGKSAYGIDNQSDAKISLEPQLTTQSDGTGIGSGRYWGAKDALNEATKFILPGDYHMSNRTTVLPVAGIDEVQFRYLKEYLKLNYDPNGGTGSTPAQTENDDGQTMTIAENGFTRNGDNFIGWNTKADGTGIAYQPGDSLVLPKNMTLYAQWESKPEEPTDPLIPVKPEEPAKPVVPTDPDEPENSGENTDSDIPDEQSKVRDKEKQNATKTIVDTNQTNTQATLAKEKNAQLPQTGNSSFDLLSIILLLTSGLISTFGYSSKQTKRN
jgi:uncharacterized repeat protein (TIGR02543 family)